MMKPKSAAISSAEPLKHETCFLKVSMHCECKGCRRKLEKVLRSIDGQVAKLKLKAFQKKNFAGVSAATIDRQQQKVTVTGSVGVETLISKLAKAGKRAEIWPENLDGKGKTSGEAKKGNGGRDPESSKNHSAKNANPNLAVSVTKETDYVLGVEYKVGQKKRCRFQLKASCDNNGVWRICFGLDDSADNQTYFDLEIRRDGRGGLCGGIRGTSSGKPTSSTRTKQNYSVETTILSYGCSQRNGLFVLELKKGDNFDNAYVGTLAHYYLTKNVGLSFVAKIQRKKGSFGVQVERPFEHPSADLRKVLVQTCRAGAWMPAACSHCVGAKGSTSISQSGDSPPSNHKNDDTKAQTKRLQQKLTKMNYCSPLKTDPPFKKLWRALIPQGITAEGNREKKSWKERNAVC